MQHLTEMALNAVAKDPNAYLDTRHNLRGTFCDMILTALRLLNVPGDINELYGLVRSSVADTNHNRTTDDADGERIAYRLGRRLNLSENDREILTETAIRLVKIARGHTPRHQPNAYAEVALCR